jgi:hypothetical protein
MSLAASPKITALVFGDGSHAISHRDFSANEIDCADHVIVRGATIAGLVIPGIENKDIFLIGNAKERYPRAVLEAALGRGGAQDTETINLGGLLQYHSVTRSIRGNMVLSRFQQADSKYVGGPHSLHTVSSCRGPRDVPYPEGLQLAEIFDLFYNSFNPRLPRPLVGQDLADPEQRRALQRTTWELGTEETMQMAARAIIRRLIAENPMLAPIETEPSRLAVATRNSQFDLKINAAHFHARSKLPLPRAAAMVQCVNETLNAKKNLIDRAAMPSTMIPSYVDIDRSNGLENQVYADCWKMRPWHTEIALNFDQPGHQALADEAYLAELEEQ